MKNKAKMVNNPHRIGTEWLKMNDSQVTVLDIGD